MSLSQFELLRAQRIVQDVALDRLQLDLRGVHVVTEAATGPFAVTASIAAVAGARVTAVAADSQWGSFEEASRETIATAKECGAADRIQVVRRDRVDFADAQIVTNLGFVRPIDSKIISQMGFGSVIPLMYDSRELRQTEIDLELCAARGIAVIGTNEDHPLVDVLRHSGHLVLKMLFESGIEVLRSRVCLLGENLFTPHVARTLQGLGAEVIRCRDWRDCLEAGGKLDALVYLDYWNTSGQIDSVKVGHWLKLNSGASLIQFVGGLDIEPFRTAGWAVRPESAIQPQRMWRTLADLGIRPVIELHTAGLKAAEMELRGVPHDTPGRLCGLRQAIDLAPRWIPISPVRETA